MATPIERLDVPAQVVAADVHLHQLLDDPPCGHTPEPQTDEWYKRVFADMATAHQDRITGGQA